MPRESQSTDKLLETIRGLDEGDDIKVTFGWPATHNIRRAFTVTNVSMPDNRPLVELDPRFDHDEEGETILLEYDPYYSDETPYNLRWLLSDHDGKSVVSVQDDPHAQ